MIKSFLLKLRLRRELKRVTKEKTEAIKNLQFELAANLRDREKELEKVVGTSTCKASNLIPHFIAAFFKQLTLRRQYRRLKAELNILKDNEIKAVENLDYDLANQIGDQKNDLLKQLERLEEKLKTLN